MNGDMIRHERSTIKFYTHTRLSLVYKKYFVSLLHSTCPMFHFIKIGTTRDVRYRMTDPGMPAGNSNPPALFSFCGPGKTCQNLRVSSPAPVTIVDPSGDSAR